MRHTFVDTIYDNGFWRAIRYPFVCPACDGEGGETEDRYVLYTCSYCNGECYVGYWRKLLSLHDWWLSIAIDTIKSVMCRRQP